MTREGKDAVELFVDRVRSRFSMDEPDPVLRAFNFRVWDVLMQEEYKVKAEWEQEAEEEEQAYYQTRGHDASGTYSL